MNPFRNINKSYNSALLQNLMVGGYFVDYQVVSSAQIFFRRTYFTLLPRQKELLRCESRVYTIQTNINSIFQFL